MTRGYNKNENKFIERDNYWITIVRENFIMYRELHKLTQEKLANILGYEKSRIAKMESKNTLDNFHLPILTMAAKLYKISITDFFINHEDIYKQIFNIDNAYIKQFKKLQIYENKYYNIVRENIFKYRILKGYSQSGLSSAIGFSKNYIRHIEVGTQNCTIITLGRLSDLLNIPISKFFIKSHKDKKNEDNQKNLY